jgi:hypothetical protein
MVEDSFYLIGLQAIFGVKGDFLNPPLEDFGAKETKQFII